MNADTIEEQLDQSLVAIWKTLHQAQAGSACFIEGLISEIGDEAVAPEQRIASVGQAWWPFLAGGRGIFDFCLWSGNPRRDREAKENVREHVERVCQLLKQYDSRQERPLSDQRQR
ncbi:hypothetical protein HRR99_09510 [Agrobacterium vaccinii]|uniref:hypothetical protein n=1 Tax=Agrobacterium vaccinii TaxID=2735528 RepID=UPI001E3B28AE|nr:hypothetical protein [Agrobacterium vaccinii]UHS61733.1 hypothetical protein HRR99_09510 [Agrobacterium vaccinii]